MSQGLEGKRVLLVDDDNDILTSMQAAFEPTGATVEVASNGNKAVELAEKGQPDVVVLDMMLPGRSGFLVLEKIKSKKPKNAKPFVIMITGNQGARHKMYAESLGVSEYLTKPVKMDKLIATAQRLVGARRRRETFTVKTLKQFSWERMVNAVEDVRRRMLKAAAALRAANIPYSVAGGNAVAVWVSLVDKAAVRNTQDVDILIRREDLDAAKIALESVGFVYRHVGGIDAFLDGPTARVRDAVHIIFANEKVRPNEPSANPDVTESEEMEDFRVMTLDPLVKIKLTSFRDKDRTHLRDMIDIGLIDATWVAKLPRVLGDRLQQLIDSPNG